MRSSFYSVSARSITLLSPSHEVLAELPLRFHAGGTTFQATALLREADGWTVSTADPAVTIRITEKSRSLCVELCGPFHNPQDLLYFQDSSIRTSHVHAFIPDEQLGLFPASQNRVFTLSNQAAMRQRLGLKEEFWMLAPQPHVLALGDPSGAGFSFSIPECLPADAVQFILENKKLALRFLHHVPACDGNRLPRVFIDLGTASKEEALDRHLAHAKKLGLVQPEKPQPSWWHNPLYCTWGDQCFLAGRGLDKRACLTRGRILAWASKIRSFYQDEVNFIIDDGYFLCMGDFRLQPALYPTVQEFRSLIDELKALRFRVILWYTPFWVDAAAAVVQEHPDWLLRRTDGVLADNTGDWKGKYHFDWSHPELREHHRGLIRHLLEDLGADGIKIDMTYANLPGSEIFPHNPSWASGNLACKRVLEFIHHAATAIRPDVFLTVNGVESYLQPFTPAVRLNDLFNFTDPSAWYRRAELVLRTMPGVAIDIDGWPAAPAKLREYPFIASVYGAPVVYYLDGTEAGDISFGDAETNRTAAIWNTYAHAPVEQGDQITVRAEENFFERRSGDGSLKALSLARSVFVACGESIRVCANSDLAVAIPLENRKAPGSVTQINRDGSKTSIPFLNAQNRCLFFAEDSAKGILYYEIL